MSWEPFSLIQRLILMTISSCLLTFLTREARMILKKCFLASLRFKVSVLSLISKARRGLELFLLEWCHYYAGTINRYKALVPGNSNWSVEYKGKLFCCSSKEQLEKFMKLVIIILHISLLFISIRYPSYYEVTNLPVKLPPTKQPLSILSLPMLGYMEQSVATPIINSLTDVGCYKPKYPFLTATQSALVYVALHLKGDH